MTTVAQAVADTSSPWFGKRIWRVLKGPLASEYVAKEPNALRIGIVGAANIAPAALIHPARLESNIIVAGITARDKERARAFAERHSIEKVYDDYAAMLADPDIDAVYVPSPNGLHYQHTVLALRAGKHVLCEKPLASNAEEAALMVQEAASANRVLFEAFHYRYHPAVQRSKEIIETELGKIKSVHINFPIPSVAFNRSDIRFNYQLAGGALMDAGCYSINYMRYLLGAEPTSVTNAECVAQPTSREVDDTTTATLAFADPATTATIACTLVGSIFNPLAVAKVTCERGEMTMVNFVLPHLYHKITVTPSDGPSRVEQVYDGGRTTYLHQLRAFVAAVRGTTPDFPTTADDGVATMRVVDAIYEKAEMPLRKGKPLP